MLTEAPLTSPGPPRCPQSFPGEPCRCAPCVGHGDMCQGASCHEGTCHWVPCPVGGCHGRTCQAGRCGAACCPLVSRQPVPRQPGRPARPESVPCSPDCWERPHRAIPAERAPSAGIPLVTVPGNGLLQAARTVTLAGRCAWGGRANVGRANVGWADG